MYDNPQIDGIKSPIRIQGSPESDGLQEPFHKTTNCMLQILIYIKLTVSEIASKVKSQKKKVHTLSYIINYVESLNHFFVFFAVIHEDQPFPGAWAAENTTGFGRWRGWRPGQRLWRSFRGRGPVESRWPPHDFMGKQWKKQGLVNVPFWEYWTSAYSSHYRPYTSWLGDVQWGHLMTHEKTHVFSMSLAVVKKIVQYFQPSMALSSTSTFRLLRMQHRTRRLSCSCQMVGWHSMNWRYKLAVSLRQNGVCWILNSCISFHFTRDTRVIVLVPCKQWQLCALATAAHLLQRVSKPTDSAHGEDELLMTRQIHQRLPRKGVVVFCGSLHAKHWISAVEECVKCS